MYMFIISPNFKHLSLQNLVVKFWWEAKIEFWSLFWLKRTIWCKQLYFKMQLFIINANRWKQ